MFENMIAYMEIASKVRVLEISIKYLEDYEGLPIMMDLHNFIATEIRPTE